ncbi:Coiled-coil domain-containing protein 112 [Acropora cervicornis]|uniref:Coiled-coil domain-containing protein 112 n=1 Tax=Acropora cervicornis TaxID=6130 RepID=A0AAD9UX63_ACRCE|nr:Coiled-coil domain-containing protein 112 [Acropora cervicornis]
MEEIENSMMIFKEQQRKVYDQILQEERIFTQEVSAVDKKFDSWCQLPVPVTAAVEVKKASGSSTASLPRAVAAFERFLAQTGGHQGGWDDYDHQLFLKLKGKHKAGKRETLKDDDGEIEEEERKKKKREEKIEKERDERIKQLNEWKVQKELEKAKMDEERLGVKAHVEEYAKQRAEEQAILRAAQQVREEKNREALKLTAEEVVKIQGRVSIIPVVGPDITESEDVRRKTRKDESEGVGEGRKRKTTTEIKRPVIYLSPSEFTVIKPMADFKFSLLGGAPCPSPLQPFMFETVPKSKLTYLVIHLGFTNSLWAGNRERKRDLRRVEKVWHCACLAGNYHRNGEVGGSILETRIVLAIDRKSVGF